MNSERIIAIIAIIAVPFTGIISSIVASQKNRKSVTF